MGTRRLRAGTTVVAAAAAFLFAFLVTMSAALGQGEGPDFAKTEERNTYITKTPEFQERLRQQNIDDQQDLAAIVAAEAAALPGDQRNFTGNICHQRKQECAGDVRLYDWEANGFGGSELVTFGARSGATLSGKVWATEAGPAKRPGIVITTGSVQAPQTLYWSFAQVLAKRGYVVLTYDVQGQGRSDTSGEAPDQNEGVPAQQPQNFVDGSEDALNFFLSTPDSPYVPVDSCGNENGGVGTSHAAKHDRRVAVRLNAAHNPFWELVDPERIGVAGHSLGASGVSYSGQLDPRVDAIVAWDNLRDGGNPGVDCPSGSSPRPADAGINKPAIGMSNDYGLFTDSNYDESDAETGNGGFQAYKDAGMDAMQVNRRGGTHYEYSFIPGETVPQLGLATLRGNDMAVWYTVAWFDRYVKCQGRPACRAEADRMLLSDRWRDDPREGQVDYSGDSNMYSRYMASRFDFTDASGAARICDDMRSGCGNMRPDGAPPGFDFLAEANTPDAAGPGGGPACTIARVGTRADDTPRTLPPTAAGDSIRGRGGDDRLRGRRGDDCLWGNGGDDRLSGNKEDDRLFGGKGRDRLAGGKGKDMLRGNNGNDALDGRRGRDRIWGGSGRDRLQGGPGNDLLVGGGGSDTFRAADGERDIIVCNRGRRDRVLADRIDRVGKACDRVRIK